MAFYTYFCFYNRSRMQNQINFIHKNYSRFATHLLFWFIYLVFSAFQFSMFRDSPDLENVVYRMLISIWIDIGATYFTVYYLFPKFLFTKKYVSFVSYFLLSVAIIMLLQRLLLYYVSYPIFSPQYVQDVGFWNFNPLYIFFNIYTIVSVFASIKLLKIWFKYQQQKEELENQNRVSELTLLKSQVSPHFLFNTLNNIDSLIISDQTAASDSVIKLSEILRYMLYEANTDFVSLEKELFYLQSYISLQLLRIKNNDFVKFDTIGNMQTQKIAPMLLIPFVENAFKHGLKNTQSPGIKIILEANPEFINFKVVNKINKWENVSIDHTNGIGLINVKRRLDLIYPKVHQLDITNNEEIFSVALKILNK